MTGPRAQAVEFGDEVSFQPDVRMDTHEILKGIVGAETKDDDWVEHLFVGTTHDYLMIFTNRGQAHWKKVYELPEGGRASKGRPIVNLLERLAAREPKVLPAAWIVLRLRWRR